LTPAGVLPARAWPWPSRSDPLGIGGQPCAGPAAVGPRLVEGEVHRGFVVSRHAAGAEGGRPGPAGRADPAGLVDLAAALALSKPPTRTQSMPAGSAAAAAAGRPGATGIQRAGAAPPAGLRRRDRSSGLRRPCWRREVTARIPRPARSSIFVQRTLIVASPPPSARGGCASGGRQSASRW
jgi:hypothetical protein